MAPMRRAMLRLAPILQLTRVTTAFASVANVWFVILWTRAAATPPGLDPADAAAVTAPPLEPGTEALRTLPLWALLLGGAVNALGLFAYAAALNDVLDFRRDRALHPDRPLPSGRLTIGSAITLVVCTFIAAVLGAAVLGIGSVVLTLLIAGAILFFNGAGRFVPAVGLIVLGLIYAGQMVTPNLNLRFVWPVWLVMTHSLLVATAAHIYGRKVPLISRRAAATAVAGWAFWSAVMFFFAYRRSGTLWPEWVSPSAALGPAVLAGLFALWAWQKVRTHGRSARAAEKVSRYGALWLALYACAWMFGQGYTSGGFILTALTVVGFVGMTTLREIYNLIQNPLGYRR
jgi:4-hydroxybenzoate polyprenyltransferase